MELDVFITADKEVVCFHDTTLDRLTGEMGFVSDHDFEDLPPLKKTLVYDTEQVTYTQTAADDGKWLKLGDLFANMPPTVLYSIDLKGSRIDKEGA